MSGRTGARNWERHRSGNRENQTEEPWNFASQYTIVYGSISHVQKQCLLCASMVSIIKCSEFARVSGLKPNVTSANPLIP